MSHAHRFLVQSICMSIVTSLTFCLFASAAERPPNVLFILTDDQGWGDAHFAGHPYVKTPNLDKFASQSTWIRQFYVAATVCSPSRTAFMTSNYPARHLVHGHFSNHEANASRSMPDWLDPTVPNLARILKSAGYATGHFGKWHLGSGEGAPAPSDYGFDLSKTVNSSGPQLGDEAKDPFFRAKSTELIVDETIRFMKENRDRPFYANVWTLVPHALLRPTQEQLKGYETLDPSANAPGFGKWMREYGQNAKNLRSQAQTFYASLTDLDTQMGRLFEAIKELQLENDTIIFYSSDNGPEDYRVANASNAGLGSTGPLRGRKRSMYEGGVRTFGLVRWPGHIPAGRVDETNVIGAVDFLPTICKLAGAAVPAGHALDGEDVSDMWLGNNRPRTKPLHWEWLFNVQGRDDGYMPPQLAIRDGDWKLFVRHDGSDAELYNIPSDIGEENNLASTNPDLVQSMKQKALAWVKTLPPSPVRDEVLRAGGPPDAAKTKSANKGTAKAATSDRSKIFKQKDTNADGRLSLEEYLHRFPDEAEGRRRFPTFDTNSDGQLSEEEFVRAGKPIR